MLHGLIAGRARSVAGNRVGKAGRLPDEVERPIPVEAPIDRGEVGEGWRLGEKLEGQLDEVSALVKAKALALCGIKTEKAGNTPPDIAAAKVDLAPAKPRTKADLEREVLAKAGGTAETKPMAEAKTPEPEGEDFGEFNEDADENQPEITDMDLSTALTHASGRLKAVHGGKTGMVLKALINTFVEPPKKSHDIPQKLRASFLKKLEALT